MKKETKILDFTRQVRTQDLSRVKQTTSHYATVERASAVKNTGCIRGAYLRYLVSLKTIPATKKPLVKNLEPRMSFSAVPINTDKEIENKFLVFGSVKMLLRTSVHKFHPQLRGS